MSCTIKQKLYENYNFSKLSVFSNKSNLQDYLILFRRTNALKETESESSIISEILRNKNVTYVIEIENDIGERLLAETSAIKLDEAPNGIGIFALFIKDITVKKLNEEKSTKQKLRNYLYTIHAVDMAQERERERFARDLHDGLGQVLNSIKLNLNLLSKFNVAEQNEIIAEVKQAVSYSLNEIRNIAYGIAPPSLTKYGLISAISEICNKSILISGRAIRFKTNINDSKSLLSKGEELNLYRIIQESVNNIFKHSKASDAEISLYKILGIIICVISDNGVGMPEYYSEESLGLRSIRARCEIINAGINIKRVSGTSIEILINKRKSNES